MLQEPELFFSNDPNDPSDLGGWRFTWGAYRICLSSQHANADKLYIYLERMGDDEDNESMIVNNDGSIELGAYGIHTSFHDLLECLSIRKALRLLKSDV